MTPAKRYAVARSYREWLERIARIEIIRAQVEESQALEALQKSRGENMNNSFRVLDGGKSEKLRLPEPDPPKWIYVAIGVAGVAVSFWALMAFVQELR